MIVIPGLRLLASAIYGIDLDEAAPEGVIRQIEPRPILLIHGERDPVIPHDHAERLKRAAGPSATLWSLPGMEHTQGILLVPDCETPSPTRDAYLQRSVAFFRRHLGADDAARSAAADEAVAALGSGPRRWSSSVTGPT